MPHAFGTAIQSLGFDFHTSKISNRRNETDLWRRAGILIDDLSLSDQGLLSISRIVVVN